MSLPFLNTEPGYDEALRNSVFFERGLLATSICGAVGAAVAVAMLQGQDEAGVASAAGIAASMGAGLLAANRTGGTAKWVHRGWAAHCGVAAADLARDRLTGRPTVLEGRFGFLQAFCGDRRPPGRRRPRPGHGLGAAARGLQAVPVQPRHPRERGRRPAAAGGARGSPPADVTAIELGVAKPVLRTIAEPPEELARKFHDNAVRSLPEGRAAGLAARPLALPDAQSVEDLTALLTSAGESDDDLDPCRRPSPTASNGAAMPRRLQPRRRSSHDSVDTRCPSPSAMSGSSPRASGGAQGGPRERALRRQPLIAHSSAAVRDPATPLG